MKTGEKITHTHTVHMSTFSYAFLALQHANGFRSCITRCDCDVDLLVGLSKTFETKLLLNYTIYMVELLEMLLEFRSHFCIFHKSNLKLKRELRIIFTYFNWVWHFFNGWQHVFLLNGNSVSASFQQKISFTIFIFIFFSLCFPFSVIINTL